MAGEDTNKDLMNRFSDDRLGAPANGVPARRGDQQPSDLPVDPGKGPSTVQARGKTPEQLAAEQAEQQPTKPAPKPAPDDGEPPLAAKGKGKAPEQTWPYRGEQLTLKQILERGLLEKVFTSAEQLPGLQKKYQESLEQIAAIAAAKPAPTPEVTAKAAEEAERQHQAMTLKVIQEYAPYAKKEMDFYIASGLIEQDFADAYPLGSIAMFAIFLYHLDAIQSTASRTEEAIKWIRAEADFKHAVQTQSKLFGVIDAVLARHKGKPTEQFFAGLKEPETRGQFVNWLRKEVDLPVDKINEETIGSQWLAFNSGAIMEFAQAEKEDDLARQPSRRSASDGVGARVESPDSDQPKTLLEKMTDRALHPEE